MTTQELYSYHVKNFKENNSQEPLIYAASMICARLDRITNLLNLLQETPETQGQNQSEMPGEPLRQ